MKVMIIGAGPAAAGAAIALTASPDIEVQVLDVGGRLEEANDAARLRMSRSDPAGWAEADRRAVSQVAVALKGHRLPEKRNFGSDFPFRNFGQLDGLQGVGDVNTHVISGAYGGFSNTWGAGVMVFSAASFDEWPFSRSDLELDYRAVLDAIPYAAEDDDLSEYFPLWGPAKPLPPLGENATRILSAYERHRIEMRRRGVILGKARLALQAERCVSCGLCMTGCPYSFVYSASQTFDNLVRDNRVEYMGGHVALRVGEQDGRPFVNAHSLDSGRVDTFFADKILLACGALGTTRLVAQSLGLWSTPIHVHESAQFLAPFVSLRGVKRLTQDGTFTLNQFNIVLPFDETGHDIVEIHGYPYNEAMDEALPRFLRRPGLRFVRSEILKRLTVGIGYLPSWWSPGFDVKVAPPESEDSLASMTITPSSRSASASAEEKVREVVRRLARSARYLGWAPIGPQFVLSAPGKSYHFGGSFPTRPRPRTARPISRVASTRGATSTWWTRRFFRRFPSPHSPCRSWPTRIASLAASPSAHVPDETSPVVGITGSTGYLGQALVRSLRAQGHDVVEYGRSARVAASHSGTRQLDLADLKNGDAFDGVSIVVHAAWDLHENRAELAWRRNVDGSKQLLEMALASGVRRFIFVSSMSAYFGTKQNYGLMKLAVERSVLEADQIVVRPGLVYDEKKGGMAGTLAKLAQLPIIPVPSGAQQFTLDIEDFLTAMSTLVTASAIPSSVIGLAHESPVSFKKLMREFATDQGSSSPTVVVPWRAILVFMRVLEALHLPSPVRSDSLLGLVRPAPFVPGRKVAESLGLSFRAFQSAAEEQSTEHN